MCIKSSEQARNSHNMADEDVTDESGGGEGLQQQGPGPSTSTLNSSNNTTPSGYNTMPGGYPINNIPSPPGNGGSYLEEEVGLDEDGDVTVSLPKALIVTGVDSAIFEDVDAKDEFENLFKAFDDEAFVQYLKCFRRARVVFSSALLAAKARIHLHETELGGKTLKCYFAQPTKCLGSQAHLEPPKPVRQHLISPPASPPVGWEPTLESDPVINYDLLAAVANLSPGEAHELHPPTEDQPGIVVHICEDPEGFRSPGAPKPRIVQTKCPDRVN